MVLLTHIGEFPPPHLHLSPPTLSSPHHLYNGYLQGTVLGVSAPALAGGARGVAVSDAAHVSMAPGILGFFWSLRGGSPLFGERERERERE